MAGHMTLVTDPVDGADRALHLVLVGRGARCGSHGEMQFEAVHPVPERDEMIPKLCRGQLQARHLDEPIERLHERIQRRGPVLNNTHFWVTIP